jgi:hypothetical protein
MLTIALCAVIGAILGGIFVELGESLPFFLGYGIALSKGIEKKIFSGLACATIMGIVGGVVACGIGWRYQTLQFVSRSDLVSLHREGTYFAYTTSWRGAFSY